MPEEKQDFCQAFLKKASIKARQRSAATSRPRRAGADVGGFFMPIFLGGKIRALSLSDRYTDEYGKGTEKSACRAPLQLKTPYFTVPIRTSGAHCGRQAKEVYRAIIACL